MPSFETASMKPGDMIRTPVGVPHCARNIGDEATRAVIVFSAGDRQTTALEEQ